MLRMVNIADRFFESRAEGSHTLLFELKILRGGELLVESDYHASCRGKRACGLDRVGRVRSVSLQIQHGETRELGIVFASGDG